MTDEVVKKNDTGMSLVDLTELARIEALRKDITSVDLYSAPMFMRDFTTACMAISRAIQNVKNALSLAERDAAYEESKALLERAPLYFAERKAEGGMKDSMAQRQAYVAMDQQYREAVGRKDQLKALLRYLEDKMELYKMDHYTVKMIYSKMESPHGGDSGMKSGGKTGDREE